MTRILIVDDDASIREITQLALEANGFEVATAASGQHALDALARHPADAILLDVRMPFMSGAEFARRYRELNASPAPIVVLTAGRDGDAVTDVLRGSRHVEKPFDVDDLVRTINEVIGARA